MMEQTRIENGKKGLVKSDDLIAVNTIKLPCCKYCGKEMVISYDGCCGLLCQTAVKNDRKRNYRRLNDK